MLESLQSVFTAVSAHFKTSLLPLSPPPSPDGNPFAHIYWLAEENNETTHTTTKTSLAPLQNIKDKLKAHMSKHHRLGDANTNSGYYN